MLYLHQFPGLWNLPSLSPFCIKVDTYLRMVNLTYEIVLENNPLRGPKGKFPVLRDNEIVIPDSSFIIHYLKKTYGDPLDQALSEKDKALSLAVQRLIEENLYFVILYSRWIDPIGINVIHQSFKQFFPKPIAPIALAWIRRQLRIQGKKQGIARHTRDEVYQIGQQNIHALSVLLGENPYFLGKEPHSIDASVYAFIETILLTPIMSPLQNNVIQHPQLLAYCERMRNRYYEK